MDDAMLRPLVERAQRGDEVAFGDIYADLAPRVLRFLRHEVRDAETAEDLMQRTFVRAIEGLPRYRPRDGVPFAAWIFRIARNAVIDDHRATHQTTTLEAAEDLPESTPGPAELAEAEFEHERLVEALEGLPPDQHDVLVYRFFAELRPPEVARLMTRSEGAVRVLQHRALGSLRRRLERETGRPPDAAPVEAAGAAGAAGAGVRS